MHSPPWKCLRLSEGAAALGLQAARLERAAEEARPQGGWSKHPARSGLQEDTARSRWAPGDLPGQPAGLFTNLKPGEDALAAPGACPPWLCHSNGGPASSHGAAGRRGGSRGRRGGGGEGTGDPAEGAGSGEPWQGTRGPPGPQGEAEASWQGERGAPTGPPARTRCQAD